MAARTLLRHEWSTVLVGTKNLYVAPRMDAQRPPVTVRDAQGDKDAIHAQNARPHRATMRDESAKSKGKPSKSTAFVVADSTDDSFQLRENTRVSITEPWPKLRIRGGGGGDFPKEFKDKDQIGICKCFARASL